MVPQQMSHGAGIYISNSVSPTCVCNFMLRLSQQESFIIYSLASMHVLPNRSVWLSGRVMTRKKKAKGSGSKLIYPRQRTRSQTENKPTERDILESLTSFEQERIGSGFLDPSSLMHLLRNDHVTSRRFMHWFWGLLRRHRNKLRCVLLHPFGCYFKDEHMFKLVDVLIDSSSITMVNFGELTEVTNEGWIQLARALPKTNICFMFAEQCALNRTAELPAAKRVWQNVKTPQLLNDLQDMATGKQKYAEIAAVTKPNFFTSKRYFTMMLRLNRKRLHEYIYGAPGSQSRRQLYDWYRRFPANMWFNPLSSSMFNAVRLHEQQHGAVRVVPASEKAPPPEPDTATTESPPPIIDKHLIYVYDKKIKRHKLLFSIRKSPIPPQGGFGLFAEADIPKNTNLGPYTGEVIVEGTKKEVEKYPYEHPELSKLTAVAMVPGRKGKKRLVNGLHPGKECPLAYINSPTTEGEDGRRKTLYKFHNAIFQNNGTVRTKRDIITGEEICMKYGRKYPLSQQKIDVIVISDTDDDGDNDGAGKPEIVVISDTSDSE